MRTPRRATWARWRSSSLARSRPTCRRARAARDPRATRVPVVCLRSRARRDSAGLLELRLQGWAAGDLERRFSLQRLVMVPFTLCTEQHMASNLVSVEATPGAPRAQAVGDRCFEEGLFEPARAVFAHIPAWGRLASTLVRLHQFQAAVDAARKANSPKTWKEARGPDPNPSSADLRPGALQVSAGRRANAALPHARCRVRPGVARARAACGEALTQAAGLACQLRRPRARRRSGTPASAGARRRMHSGALAPCKGPACTRRAPWRATRPYPTLL